MFSGGAGREEGEGEGEVDREARFCRGGFWRLVDLRR